MTSSATAQATREFIIRETAAELRIVEVFPGTANEDEHLSRQAAWDRARSQEKPVVVLTLDRAPQSLGVVYDPDVAWAAMKREAAALEADQERQAYEAEAGHDAKFAAFQAAKHAQPAAFHEGYFTLDGAFVKVMLNRARTRHYARTLDAATGHWNHAAGLMGQWRRMRPATIEDARAFGKLHHYCFRCGTELTKPQSIDDGVGPDCKKKLGW